MHLSAGACFTSITLFLAIFFVLCLHFLFPWILFHMELWIFQAWDPIANQSLEENPTMLVHCSSGSLRKYGQILVELAVKSPWCNLARIQSLLFVLLFVSYCCILLYSHWGFSWIMFRCFLNFLYLCARSYVFYFWCSGRFYIVFCENFPFLCDVFIIAFREVFVCLP